MKTCKKCKKQSANNVKICKNCGADLSKIKPTPNNKDKKVKVEKIQPVKENDVNLNFKTEFLFTDDYKNVINEATDENVEKKESVKDKKVFFNKQKLEETKKKLKQSLEIKNKKKSKKEEKLKANEEIKKQLEELFDDQYDIDSDMPDLLFAEKFKLQKKSKSKSIKVEKKKNKVKIKDIKIKDLFSKDKKIIKNKKGNKNKKKSVKKKVKQLKEPETLKLTKAQQLKLAKKKLNRKKLRKYIILFILFVGLGYGIYALASKQIDYGTIITEENRNKIYQMGEKVSYKKISYTIDSVETSEGTAYKKPKEGNQYLIVTITFENNSDEKYKYYSEDWKMINSLDEETSRIISPVNAGKALYNGELVVGATKTASLVFEQPIGDKKLLLRFYDPVEMNKYLEEKEAEEKRLEQEKLEHPENFIEEVVDEKAEEPKVDEKYPKPIFNIKIKVK